jgi:hypothetical protein
VISMALLLSPGISNRCGPLYGPMWQAHVFMVKPDGSIGHLGHGLRFVGAGDFDGDGRSELLFQSVGYNRDGYQLVYGDGSKTAHFEWATIRMEPRYSSKQRAMWILATMIAWVSWPGSGWAVEVELPSQEVSTCPLRVITQIRLACRSSAGSETWGRGTSARWRQ